MAKPPPPPHAPATAPNPIKDFKPTGIVDLQALIKEDGDPSPPPPPAPPEPPPVEEPAPLQGSDISTFTPEPPPDDLSKADASRAIEDLQSKTGRGR